MKKNILTLLSLSLIVISCKKEKEDFNQLRTNIIGSWELTETIEEIKEDTVFNQSTYNYSVSFEANGTGIKTEQFLSFSFDWLHQIDPQKVFITPTGNILQSISLNFTVIKNEIDSHLWRYETNNDYIYKWKLIRK